MEKKITLITGATCGIGEACARKFAQEGYRLIITGRKENRLEQLKTELEQYQTEVCTLCFDVRDREQTTKLIESLNEKWADIDILINNAGLALGLEKEYEGKWEDWETMIDTNIKGLLTMTRLIVPRMVKRNQGHIINIGSVAGDAAYANGNVYCATKAAVKTLGDGLRIDLADTAVRVTTIMLFRLTDMTLSQNSLVMSCSQTRLTRSPVLLMSTSRPPRNATASWTILTASSSFVRSAWKAAARCPSDWACLTNASAPSLLLK